MNLYLSEFLDEFMQSNDIPKNIVGTVSSGMLILNSGLPVSVEFDLVDLSKRAVLRSGSYVPPLSRNGRDRFFQFLLNFNRDCISHLPGAGLMPILDQEDAFAFTWLAPKREVVNQEWQKLINVYDQLAMEAAYRSKKVMEEWIHYPH